MKVRMEFGEGDFLRRAGMSGFSRQKQRQGRMTGAHCGNDLRIRIFNPKH